MTAAKRRPLGFRSQSFRPRITLVEVPRLGGLPGSHWFKTQHGPPAFQQVRRQFLTRNRPLCHMRARRRDAEASHREEHREHPTATVTTSRPQTAVAAVPGLAGYITLADLAERTGRTPWREAQGYVSPANMQKGKCNRDTLIGCATAPGLGPTGVTRTPPVAGRDRTSRSAGVALCAQNAAAPRPHPQESGALAGRVRPCPRVL